MTGLRLSVFASCVLSFAVALGAQQTFAIRGTAVSASTGKPLPHVLVTIAQVKQRDAQLSVKTGDDGRFNFTDVPPGKYQLVTEYRGLTRLLDQDGNFSTAVVAGPHMDSEHLMVPVQTPARLRIRVLDEEGEVVRNCNIVLMRKGIREGRAHISQVGAQSSFSAGAYHFTDLLPGDYFVSVSASPWYTQGFPNNEASDLEDDLHVAYPATFYPNTRDVNSALPLRLSEEQETQISITLTPVRWAIVRVAGLAPAASPDNNGPLAKGSDYSVYAEPVGPGGLSLYGPGAVNGPQGNGSSILLAPGGRYVFSLSRPLTDEDSQARETLRSRPIDVTGDLTLDLSAFTKTTLSGRVTFAGVRPKEKLGVLLARLGGGPGSIHDVEKDGTFSAAIAPGKYFVELSPFSVVSVASLKAEGAELHDGVLELLPGSTARLSIAAAPAASLSELDGLALSANKPAPGSLVVLIPDEGSFSGSYPRDQSDADGTFTLHQVPPGRYHLLAIDNGRDLEYHNGQAVKPYIAEAPAVTIPLATSDPLTVTVQKRRPE